MTNLRQLLAYNIKQNRRRLKFSQAKLAEVAQSSTQYIAMIEMERKFPSVEMIERLANAMQIDSLDLFVPLPFTTVSLRDFQNAVSADLEKALNKSINKTVRETISAVIKTHSKKLKKN